MSNKLDSVLSTFDEKQKAKQKANEKHKPTDKKMKIFIGSFRTMVRTVLRPAMNEMINKVRKHNHFAFKSAYSGGRYLQFEKEGYRFTLKKGKKYFHLLIAGNHIEQKVYIYKRIIFNDMTEEKETRYEIKNITAQLLEEIVADGMHKILKTDGNSTSDSKE